MTDSRTAPSAARFEVRVTADSHFCLGPHSPRPRTHDHVVAAYRSGADRFRLRHRSIPRTFGTDTRSPLRLSSARAAVSWARADFVWHSGACRVDLAVLVVHPLSVGRTVHATLRRYRGGSANAGHCGRRCPYRHWPVRLLRRVVPPHLVWRT